MARSSFVCVHRLIRSRLLSRRFGLYVGGCVLVFAVILSLGAYAYHRSYFALPVSRISIGVYSQEPFVVSFATNSRFHIIVPLANDHEVMVPGGYKQYKVGALGRLAELEHDDGLISRSMAVAIESLLHGYLSDSKGEVARGGVNAQKASFYAAKIRNLALFGRGDLSLLNRLYVYLKSFEVGGANTRIDTLKQLDVGAFYDRSFRSERKLVQIRYLSHYTAATTLRMLLESSGIRVVDIMKSVNSQSKLNSCIVVENAHVPSLTASFLTRHFSCEYRRGETGPYETIFILDHYQENRWKR